MVFLQNLHRVNWGGFGGIYCKYFLNYRLKGSWGKGKSFLLVDVASVILRILGDGIHTFLWL